MTRRIFRAVFTVSLVIVVMAGALLLRGFYSSLEASRHNQLTAELELAARGVAEGGVNYLRGLDARTYRVTWIAHDGTVLYDTEVPAGELENHANRAEVKKLIGEAAHSPTSGTIAESARYSHTLAERTYYRAMLLKDGTVLRLSVTQDSLWGVMAGLAPWLVGVLAVAFALAFVLSKRTAGRIVAPINTMDLDHPLSNDVYDELSPLLTRIDAQYRQIDAHIRAQARADNEFATITRHLSEGLVLVDGDGVIQSLNKAARKAFGCTKSVVGRTALTLDRSLDFQTMIDAARAGETGACQIERGGRVYTVSATPIVEHHDAQGMCLLTFDITEKTRAEEYRREFTASVTHELKTPLHAIMGSAELIENNMVAPEDIPGFATRMREESARLVSLINDILRLQQIDDAQAFTWEAIDVAGLVEQVREALSLAAQRRDISIVVNAPEPGACTVDGVRHLLYEVLYNLLDNAITYGTPGGRAVMSAHEDDGELVLSVRDNGVGIAKEHHERIFERFYRVDKSHSRSTGGTGLGLSIVKHAVAYHGGSVKLKSAPGEGTTITVRIPLVRAGE